MQLMKGRTTGMTMNIRVNQTITSIRVKCDFSPCGLITSLARFHSRG